MIQTFAGLAAPELTVAYWIDGDGNERAPLTLKELGPRYKPMSFDRHWYDGLTDD
jgi:hypothetical protein